MSDEAVQPLTPEQIALVVLACLAYLFVVFIPALVAWGRSHRSTLAIAAVCFFFGWSCLGWVVALIWSLTGDTDRR